MRKQNTPQESRPNALFPNSSAFHIPDVRIFILLNIFSVRRVDTEIHGDQTGFATYFSCIKAHFQSDLKQNAKYVPFWNCGFEDTPQKSAVEQSRHLSESAIFRQSFMAITKTAQKRRLVPTETLYSIGSCFAYGMDRKKERFANGPQKILQNFTCSLPHRAADACDESPLHPGRPWRAPASWLRRKAAPGRSG